MLSISGIVYLSIGCGGFVKSVSTIMSIEILCQIYFMVAIFILGSVFKVNLVACML